MSMRSSREEVYGNYAVQFQSCDGSSYCTVLGENGCIVIVSCQLRDSSMVRRWCGQFTEGRTTAHDEDRSGRSSLVMTSELMESVRQAVFSKPVLHNFGTLWSVPPDVLLLLHEIISRWQENVSTTTARY